MGEAKRRKSKDPNYGKPRDSTSGGSDDATSQANRTRPKRTPGFRLSEATSRAVSISPQAQVSSLGEPLTVNQRGLILNPALVQQLGPRDFGVGGHGLDPQEIRYALLYWDKIAWPKSTVFAIEGGADETWLEQAGHLIRPAVGTQTRFRDGFEMAAVMNRVGVHVFDAMEASSPGKWSLSECDNRLDMQSALRGDTGRGAKVVLHRAIPVPDKGVPLNEIAEFREKRWNELLTLREELERLYGEISGASDSAAALARATSAVDQACADVLRVGREAAFPFKLSDLTSMVDLGSINILSSLGAIAAYFGGAVNLETAGMVAGGSVTLGVQNGWRSRRKALSSHPYLYVHHIHNELLV